MESDLIVIVGSPKELLERCGIGNITANKITNTIQKVYKIEISSSGERMLYIRNPQDMILWVYESLAKPLVFSE